MKGFLFFFLIAIFTCCVAYNKAIAQVPNISYSTPVNLQKNIAVGTAPNPTIAPTNAGGAVTTTFGYSNTTTQPLTGATFVNPARGGIDNNGNIFIANYTTGNSIIEFSSSGALITSNYGGFGNVPGIAGIVFDSSNNMYILVAAGTLYKISSAGIYSGTNITFGTGTDVTLGLAIDASDNLYVADYNGGTANVYQVPNTLASKTAYITTTTNLNAPTDLAFDAAGNLYVMNNGNNTVYKYNSGTPGAGTLFESGFGGAIGLKVDKINGYVYVADDGGRMIYAYKTTGGAAAASVTGPTDCRGLILDGFGGVYAPDFNANVVYKYSPNGTYFINKMLPTGLSFSSTTGAITGTPTVNSAATDYTISGWNSFGGNSTTINITVAQSPIISYVTPQSYPTGTAIASLSPTATGGAVTAAFGYNNTPTQPFSAGAFVNPARGGVDAAGNVYIANFSGNTISKFSSTGSLITNNFTSGATLVNPAGVVFDSLGNMFVLNDNGTVMKFSSSGVYQSTITVTASTNTTIGFAIDASNNMYVTSYPTTGPATSSLVYKITAGTYAVASYLTTTTNLNNPNDVALDASGNIYILNSGTGGIYKYTSAASAGTTFGTAVSTGSYALKVDPYNSYLYVADLSAGKIFVYNLSGTLLSTITGVSDCRGLTIDNLGSVYAPDFTNNKVYKYTPSGSYFINKTLPAGLSIATGTGSITGTPTAKTSATDYTIEAWGAGGGGNTIANIATYGQATWIGGGVDGTWTNTANWSGGTLPTSTDKVIIGTTTAFTQTPLINTTTGAITVGSITMGTKGGKAPAITVTGTTLAVNGDIIFQSNNTAAQTTAYTATLGGTGSITANNLSIDLTNGTSTAAYNETLTSTINTLTLNSNLILKSSHTTGTQNALFNITSGTIALDGVTTTNANAANTSTINFASGSIVDFTGSTNPFSTLTATGNNALTLASATIGYTGNTSQSVYANGTAITNTNPATSWAYTSIVFGGTGIKTPSGALTISGNYSNTLANDASNYVNFTSTAISFTGASAQTLDGGSGTGTTFYTATFSGAGTKTINSGKFAIGSSGVLTLSGTTVPLVVGASGTLTLNSDAISSARLAAISGTSSITGTVNVQRFITGGPGMRGYRLLSSPVYGGTDASSNKVYSINYVPNSSYITGTTVSTGGIDKSGNPTLYLWRQDVTPNNLSFTSGNFRGVGDMGTGGTSNLSYGVDIDGAGFGMPAGNGFLFFFRGDRSVATITQETVTSYIPTNTILTAVGSLNQGTINVHDWFQPAVTSLSNSAATGNGSIQGYNLVGNPYASPISWTTVHGISGNGNLGTTIYEFNPATNQYGSYIIGGAGTQNAGDIIGSGQGFFVIATPATTATLTFNETAKTTSQPSVLLMGIPAGGATAAQPQFIHIKLSKDSINYDDVIVGFKTNASDKYVQDEDALHLAGNSPPETLTVLSSDSAKLSIDFRSLPTQPVSTVGLYVSATASGTLKFSKTDLQGIPSIYEIWLRDNLLKDSVDMHANATYSFTVDKNNPATYGSDRFQLVFRQSAALAIHLLNFTGNKVVNTPLQSQLTWTVENESNYTTFYLQRSTDGGKTFSSIGSLQSNGSGTYAFADKNPALGQDLYRLQLSDINNNITYSQIITLQFSNLSNSNIAGTLSVYPNPARDIVNVSINSAGSANAYSLIFTSATGSVIKRIDAVAPSSLHNISSFVPGIYYITMIDNGTKTVIAQSRFVKL